MQNVKKVQNKFCNTTTTKRGETVEQSEKHDSIMYENCCQSVKMSIYIVMHHEHMHKERKAQERERGGQGERERVSKRALWVSGENV